MEALGVAGSVVSVVAFAGQILVGLQSLHSFFGSVRDAAEDVRTLVNELSVLKAIVANIRTYSDVASNATSSTVDIVNALKCTGDSTEKLQTLVRKFEPHGKSPNGSKSPEPSRKRLQKAL